MIGKSSILGLVFFVVGILTLVILAGPATTGSGIFGNVIIAGRVREAAAVLASLTTIVGLLTFLKGLEGGN